MYAFSMLARSARPVLPARPFRANTPLAPAIPGSRSVKCNFREGSKQGGVGGTSSTRAKSPTYTPSSSSRYAGYNDDPSESLKAGWRNLKQWYADWPAEDRNRTLGFSAGALLVLYIASSLLNSLERVPLIPQTLQLVGFSFSTWFFFRYLLFEDGRRDLARDVTMDKIFNRVNDRIDDLAHQAARARDEGSDRLGSYNSTVAGRNSSSSNPTDDFFSSSSKSSGSGDGSSKLSDGSRSGAKGYTAGELDDNISGALHDLDQLADDLGPGRS